MATSYRRPRRLSAKGAEFIGRFEGFRATPYNDPVGHATIGFGHLLHHGRVTAADRKEWGSLTREQALELLRADAQRFSDAIRRLVKPKVNQAQHDALVSLAFNIGIGAFEDSTLVRVLNRYPGTEKGIVGRRALREIKEQFMRWNKAGGRELAGLTRRRAAEARLFETGRYS